MASNIFCMLNCFSNYEVVASKMVEYYITNAAAALSPGKKLNIKQYFDTTPFMLYSKYIFPLEMVNLDPKIFPRSKQLTDYVIILALTAVTLARIADSEVTVFAHQGVVLNTGFSTMYTLANVMNKKTVYWTDDLRNIWGTTDDPLFIGMAPLPYKYLWLASENPKQDPKFNTQPKGLNGSLVSPALAKNENLCPVVSEAKFKDNWNTFINLLQTATEIEKENNSVDYTTKPTRMGNLVSLGRAIIKYVEVDKQALYPTLGSGWNPVFNTTLYLDIESVINNNLGLLYTNEQEFFKANTVNSITLNDMAQVSQIIHDSSDKSAEYSRSSKISTIMAYGFSKMLYGKKTYE